MENDINFFDYWRVVVRWKNTVVLVVLVATCSSVLVSLFLPNIYRAQATLMPIGGQKTIGGLMSAVQMGLGGLSGGGSSSSSLQLMAILHSHTLAERVINKYDLIKVLFPKLWDQENQKWVTSDSEKMPTMGAAVADLFSKVFFTENKKTQLIEITTLTQSQEISAEITNDYLNELAAYISENTFTAAKKNRIFIEGQLERNKAELLTLGKELSEFYSMNKISNVVPSVNVDVSTRAEDNTWNSEKNSSPTDIQKKTIELQEKAEEMNIQLQKGKVVEDVPQQVYLQYLTLRKELLGQVNALLTQQYEMAKIDESKEDLNFQVIDWARVPEKKVKPKRSQIVMVAFMTSFLFAVFYAFFREYLEKMKKEKV